MSGLSHLCPVRCRRPAAGVPWLGGPAQHNGRGTPGYGRRPARRPGRLPRAACPALGGGAGAGGRGPGALGGPALNSLQGPQRMCRSRKDRGTFLTGNAGSSERSSPVFTLLRVESVATGHPQLSNLCLLTSSLHSYLLRDLNSSSKSRFFGATPWGCFFPTP